MAFSALADVVSVRLSGWHLPETQLGRELRECCDFGCAGRQRDGQREVIGAAEGMKEDKDSWLNFLIGLKSTRFDRHPAVYW